MAIQGIGLLSRMSNSFVRVLGFAFRLRLLFFFMLFIIINAAIIGVQTKSFSAPIEDLGMRFLTPTLKIQEFSLEVIEKGGIYQKTPKFWGGLWNLVLDLWGVITQFYIILMWISILSKLILIFPLMDKSKIAPAIIFAIPFFLVIQMTFIAKTGKGDFMQPLYAFKDFIKALPYYTKIAADIGDTLRGKTDVNISSNFSNFSS